MDDPILGIKSSMFMYARFTDRARKVMQLANQEAQRFQHEYVGTEHLLLGLIKEGAGVAACVLKNLGVELPLVRKKIDSIISPGPDKVTLGKLPQTPRVKRIIEYSIEEARSLNHDYVGTEHLLLGLLRDEDGVAVQLLRILQLNLDQVRQEVLRIINSGEDQSTALSSYTGSAPRKTGLFIHRNRHLWVLIWALTGNFLGVSFAWNHGNHDLAITMGFLGTLVLGGLAAFLTKT